MRKLMTLLGVLVVLSMVLQLAVPPKPRCRPLPP